MPVVMVMCTYGGGSLSKMYNPQPKFKESQRQACMEPQRRPRHQSRNGWWDVIYVAELV